MGEEKCTLREKILGTRTRKGPRPNYVGMGPGMVNQALTSRRGACTEQNRVLLQQHAVLLDIEQSFTEIRFDELLPRHRLASIL